MMDVLLDRNEDMSHWFPDYRSTGIVMHLCTNFNKHWSTFRICTFKQEGYNYSARPSPTLCPTSLIVFQKNNEVVRSMDQSIIYFIWTLNNEKSKIEGCFKKKSIWGCWYQHQLKCKKMRVWLIRSMSKLYPLIVNCEKNAFCSVWCVLCFTLSNRRCWRWSCKVDHSGECKSDWLQDCSIWWTK